MKADRTKLNLAMARACMSTSDVAKTAGMPRPSLNNAIMGKNVRPDTLGRIARALGVDVLDIVAENTTHSAP